MSSSRLFFLLSFTMLFAALVGCASQAPRPSILETLRHVGAPVHDDTREGYKLSFQVMTQAQKRATLSSDEEQAEASGGLSHHIMLIILSPEGRFATGAEVRFSVTGPGGTVQEAQAVPMVGGYGADVDLRTTGRYQVHAEIEVGGKKLADDFTYERT